MPAETKEEKDDKSIKKLKASFTVEAAFVIPLICMIIIALICLCLYLYERICVQCSTDCEVRSMVQGEVVKGRNAKLDEPFEKKTFLEVNNRASGYLGSLVRKFEGGVISSRIKYPDRPDIMRYIAVTENVIGKIDIKNHAAENVTEKTDTE